MCYLKSQGKFSIYSFTKLIFVFFIDCDHIERMVEFCKMQHKHCQKPNPMPSPMPSILPMKLSLAPSPFLHMSDDDRPCSAGTKRCPFKSGCFPGNSSCLSNMDIFKDMGQFHSRVVPRPTPSINGPLDASRYPSSPPIIRKLLITSYFCRLRSLQVKVM